MITFVRTFISGLLFIFLINPEEIWYMTTLHILEAAVLIGYSFFKLIKAVFYRKDKKKTKSEYVGIINN